MIKQTFFLNNLFYSGNVCFYNIYMLITTKTRTICTFYDHYCVNHNLLSYFQLIGHLYGAEAVIDLVQHQVALPRRAPPVYLSHY